MAVHRDDDQLKPEQREIFEAVDRAAKRPRTGRLVVEVVAGTAKSYHFEEEPEYPR
jgi:hypothetical protein